MSALILMGTGTSHGVPMIGCACPVCRSTDPRNNRTRTGVLVQAPNGNFLIDASPELRIQLLREKVDLIHGVVLTHGHADHIFGLDDLRIFCYYLKGAMPIFCEERVEERLRNSFDYAFQTVSQESLAWGVPQFELRRIEQSPFELLGLMVQPIRLLHGRLPVLGFRIGNVAFCTDVSAIPDESWPLLENLDVLILDALRPKPHPTHFGIDQALEVVARAKPKQAYFTHISHLLEHSETNARLPPGVELAYDGLRIPL